MKLNTIWRAIRRERGVVFMTALGIMAVLIIIAGTANTASVHSMHLAALSGDRTQAELLLHCALHSAGPGRLGAAETTLYEFGDPASAALAARVSATAADLERADPLYSQRDLKYQAGDRLLVFKATVWRSGIERATLIRRCLWNPSGQEKPLAL